MTGASKILTVSYGTFSCTLEGFDEPFSAMKAIAEYFRDLAADDRYFGAEPPTPDAAMLHRIAERAVNRRVDARIEDNSVILRTGEAMQVSPAPQPASVSPAHQATSHAAPPPAASGLLAEESVAAKLQRIRAAVARNAKSAEEAVLVDEEDTAPIFVPPLAFRAETLDGNIKKIAVPSPPVWASVDGDAGPAETAGLPDQPVVTDDDGVDRDEPVALLNRGAVDETPEPVVTAPDVSTRHGLTDGAADILVLSSNPAADQIDVLPETLPELTAEDLPEAEEDAEDAPRAALAQTVPEATVALEQDAVAQPGPVPGPAVEKTASEDGGDEERQILWDATDFLTDEKDAYKDAYGVFEDLSEGTEPAAAWPADPDLPEPAGVAANLSAAPDELNKANQQGLLASAPAPLADLASAAPQDPPAAQSEAESAAEPAQKAEGRAILEDNAKEAEDVTRLLRQTNTEMAEPENRRRLSTMAHLKAAVAATVADLRSDGVPSQTGEAMRLDRYRADLARVVRPHRPDGSPPSERPAPLVLVSEQRIDRPAPDASVNRVMHQRISTTNLAVEEPPAQGKAPAEAKTIFPSSGNFPEFAEHLGASALPDLLEAAAAYTSCMEGRPHFTRPHLMRHVATATEQSDMNREDSMRSFGTLLRQGKIAKVKRGQFAITDSSHYLAEARRMTR